MKLDATDLRYLTTEEFRVLTAVEMGSKNHEIVPTTLISQISKLRSGGINKVLGSLAKRGLVSRVQNAKYDGYRLTYGGYDYLAIRALSKRDAVAAVGNQIGVGKESDIYIVSDAEGEEMVLKLHRLGRVSFRAIKSKRDYLGKRKSASWMYMARLAAQKEFAFMKILHEHSFPVPKPIDHARHCILMELIDAYPLRQISSHPSPATLYSTLMDLIVKLAQSGLIHGDFNEFNILIHRTTGEPILIDFPQMVSTRHENAEWYFNRDVECIKTFFKRRFGFEGKLWPRFTSTVKEGEQGDGFRLDVVVSASGFGGNEQRELEKFIEMSKDEEGKNLEEENSDSEEGDGDDDDESQNEGEPTLDEVVPDSTASKTTPDDEEVESLPEQEEPESSSEASLEQGEATPARTKSKPTTAKPPKDRTSVKSTVTDELTRKKERQDRKYHSKNGIGKGGRTGGSKWKTDKRVRVGGDGWD